MFFQETEGQQTSEQKYLERLKNEDFGNTFVGKLRKYFWNLTEYPETSLAARVRQHNRVFTHQMLSGSF